MKKIIGIFLSAVIYTYVMSDSFDQLAQAFQEITQVKNISKDHWAYLVKSGYKFMIHKSMEGERGDGDLKGKTAVKIDNLEGLEQVYDNCKISGVDCTKEKQELDNFKQRLANHYKIHLMPEENDIKAVVNILKNAIENDPQVGKLIEVFKVKKDLKISYQDNDKKLPFPLIVIYPAEGKQNVQKLLDLLLDLFKNTKGSGITPRYNTKVNDLIFYAQSDADFKKPSSKNGDPSQYLKYFDKDTNYALYNKDFEDTAHDYTLKF